MTLPAWLLAGIVLGVVLSGVIAAVFYVGVRRFEGSASVAAGYDSDDRRRREVRAYLEAIDEPYVEDRAVAGTAVAFYLPEREVAITFDARAFFRIEDAAGATDGRSNAPASDPTEVTAVLLEHELPGASVGSRLPFETPAFGAGTAGGASAGRREDRPASDDRRRLRAALTALGLPPDASGEDVEAAYRRRVKEVHPDQGGDRTQFDRVREAYELASDRTD